MSNDLPSLDNFLNGVTNNVDAFLTTLNIPILFHCEIGTDVVGIKNKGGF